LAAVSTLSEYSAIKEALQTLRADFNTLAAGFNREQKFLFNWIYCGGVAVMFALRTVVALADLLQILPS